MWSRMLWRWKSFSDVKGEGNEGWWVAMYQRSREVFGWCLDEDRRLDFVGDWDERKEAASKTSSICFLYVIEVTVPETPVIVQPYVDSRASTFALSLISRWHVLS